MFFDLFWERCQAYFGQSSRPNGQRWSRDLKQPIELLNCL